MYVYATFVLIKPHIYYFCIFAIAAILGMPNVLKDSGLFAGIISMLIFALICGYASKMVIGLGKKG